MELNETRLKERFETAVGGVTPNVSALVDGGSELGAQLHRRRRAQGFGAVMASAAAVAAIAYVGVDQGIFDSDATGPANGTVSQAPTEPSTPRSLAAVAMSHIDLEPFMVGTDGGDQPEGQLSAGMGYKTTDGNAELQLAATSNLDGWDPQAICEPSGPEIVIEACERKVLDDGGEMVTLAQRGRQGTPQYFVIVAVKRPGELVAVIETTQRAVANTEAPVEEWGLPVDVDTMRAIVTDPRFGLTTDAEAIRQGGAIEDFKEGGLVQTDSGSSSSTRVDRGQPHEPPTLSEPSATQD